MEKETVAVLFGGRSAEHEVSVITALQAIQAIDSTRYSILPIYLAQNGNWYSGDALLYKAFYLAPAYQKVDKVTLLPDPSIGGFTRLSDQKTLPVDLCLLAFHGQQGEDGCLQGLLELAGLPYTGSGVFSSAIAMNKYQTKTLLSAHGIPVLPALLIRKQEAIRDLKQVQEKILSKLAFPLFIKPNHLGSSIGIAAARDIPSLNAALAKVFLYDDAALVEPQVTSLMEINAAVLDGEPPFASVVEIPVASGEALSYEDKYLSEAGKQSGGTLSGMAGLSRVIDPSDLDAELKAKVRDLSVAIFGHLDCSGVCRLDFIWDKEKETLYFNEINPIPGSLSFYLWQKSEPPLLYTELLNRMLDRAKQKKAERRSLKQDLALQKIYR